MMSFYFRCFVLAVLSTHARGSMIDLPDVPCSTTADCDAIQDAVCSTAGLCECLLGSIINSNMAKCLPVAVGYGMQCEENIQCSTRLSTGGGCTEKGTCGCSAGFHYLHGRCWKSVGLNGACLASEHCYENFNYESLSCMSQVCVCSEGFYLHESRTYCRRRGKAVNDDCFFDFDCMFDDDTMGVCTAGQCKVKSRAEVLSDHLLSELDDQHVDVVQHSTKSRHGEECNTDDECREFDPSSECSPMQFCWCPRGFFFNGSVCLKELGESCKDNADCTHIANAKCRIAEGDRDGICSCTGLYASEKSNQRCIRLRPDLTFNCQYLEESCQGFGPLAYCAMPRCECESNAHFVQEFMSCWITKGVHESCEDSRDCLTDEGGMVCHPDTKLCECDEPDFYETSSGECRRLSQEIGDPCIEDADCAYETAMCIDQRCGCETGYFPLADAANITTCATGIGGHCSVEEDCLQFVENSMCDNTTSQCVCDSATSWLVASEARDACLEVATEYGGPCVDVMQCRASFGHNTLCTDGACACIADFHFRDQACWPKKMLLEKCESTSHCFLPNESDRTECRNGFCKCKYEYVLNGENTDCLSGGTGLGEKLGVFTFLAVLAPALATLML